MGIRNPQSIRILSIAPSTRGFGFAVLDGDGLVDWGVKTVQGQKNPGCLQKIDKLLLHYRIEIAVIEDHAAGGVRRAQRIEALNAKIVQLTSSRKIRTILLSRHDIRRAFFGDNSGTKYGIAKILAERFPEEL